MALGSPENLDDMDTYLQNIRKGEKPPPALVEEMTRRYRAAGGKSPLLEITKRQAEALEIALNQNGENCKVYVGMRHWHPFIKAAVEKILEDGIQKLAALPLTPYDSRYSVTAYHESVREALRFFRSDLEVIEIRSWHNYPLLIETYAGLIQQSLRRLQSPALLFTAHSLPKRVLREKDPYPGQLRETAGLIAQKIGVSNWHFAYQSQGKTKEPWLNPTVEAMLESLSGQGIKEVLLAPIGFVSDHMEILYDVDIGFRNFAKARGMRLERTLSPNTHPDFIQTLASVVNRAIATQKNAFTLAP